MTFIPHPRIERAASDVLTNHSLDPGFDVEVLLDRLGLGLLWEVIAHAEEDHILGALRPQLQQVILNQAHLDLLEANVGLRRFTIGHEVGHWILHATGERSGMEPLLDDGRLLCRSSNRHPVEIQADIFAGCLLMPTADVRAKAPPAPWAGWRLIYDMATFFSVTPTAMVVRLIELGLAHRDDSGTPRSGRPKPAGQEVLFEV